MTSTGGQRTRIPDPYWTKKGDGTLHGYGLQQPISDLRIESPRTGSNYSWKKNTGIRYNIANKHGYYSNNGRSPWTIQDSDSSPLLPGYYHQYLTPLEPYSAEQLPLKAKICATSFKDLESDPQHCTSSSRNKSKSDIKISAYDYCNPGKHIMQPSMVKLAISHVPNGHTKKADGGPPHGLLEYRTHRVEETLTRMAVVKGDLLDLLAVQFNAREILRDMYSHVKGGELCTETPTRIHFNHRVGDTREGNHGYSNRDNIEDRASSYRNRGIIGEDDKYNHYGNGREYSMENEQQKNDRVRSDCRKHQTVPGASAASTRGAEHHGQSPAYEAGSVRSVRTGSKAWSDGERLHRSSLNQESEVQTSFKPESLQVSFSQSHASIPHQDLTRNGYQSSDHHVQSHTDRLSKSSLNEKHLGNGGIIARPNSRNETLDHGQHLQNGVHPSSENGRHSKYHSLGSDTDSYKTAQSHLGSDTNCKSVRSNVPGRTGYNSGSLSNVGDDILHCDRSEHSMTSQSKGVARNLASDTPHNRSKSSQFKDRNWRDDKCSCSCHSFTHTSHKSNESIEGQFSNSTRVKSTHDKSDLRHSDIHAQNDYKDGHSCRDIHYDSRGMHRDVSDCKNSANTLIYQPVSRNMEMTYTSNKWYPPIPGTIDDEVTSAKQMLESSSYPAFPMNSTPRGRDRGLRSRSHCGGTVPCCAYHSKLNKPRSLLPYGVDTSSTSSESDWRQVSRHRDEKKYKAYELDIASSGLTLDEDAIVDAPKVGYLNRLALYGLHEGVKPIPVTSIWDQRHMGHGTFTTSSLHSTTTPRGYSTAEDDDYTSIRNRDPMRESRLQENLHAFIMPITHKSKERASPFTSNTFQPSRVPLTTGGSVSEMSQSAGTYKRKESKPAFIIKPRRCFADEGGVGKFKASFDGVPLPSLKWQRDGVDLEQSDKYKMFTEDDFHYVEIQSVEKADKGTYSCVLTNSLGTNTASSELEVYAVRRKLETTKPDVLSTAKKFSAPTSAKLSSPASIYTKKQPETSTKEPISLKSTRHRGTVNDDPAITTTVGSVRTRGSSAADQPIRSSRSHDRQEDKFTNGSEKSSKEATSITGRISSTSSAPTAETVVSKVATKYGQDKANGGDYFKADRISNKTPSLSKTGESETPSPYGQNRSSVSSWRQTEKDVKKDENKNEMSAVTLEFSPSLGGNNATDTDLQIHQVSSDNKNVLSSNASRVATKAASDTSVLNSGRKQVNSVKEDLSDNRGSTIGTKTHASYGSTPGKTSGADRITSKTQSFEKPPSSVGNQQRIGSSLNKLPDEPVSSSRKAKSSKLRSLSQKFAEIDENDQHFFSTSKTNKPTKGKEVDPIRMDEDLKISDDLEKESSSSGVLSTEDSASVEEKVEEISEKIEDVQKDITEDEQMAEVASKVEESVEEAVVEHAPVKQQVREAKKATMVKSPTVNKASEGKSFGSSTRKSEIKPAATKTHEPKSSFGSKTTESRVSSATKGYNSRVSKTGPDANKSSRISPESSTKSSRFSPESNKTNQKSSKDKTNSQPDTSKSSSVRNRYQPQKTSDMSPSTKRVGSAHDTRSSTSPPKRTTSTGLRSGAASSAKSGALTESLTGRRGVGKAPEVAVRLTDKEARDGEYVSLKCSFTGTPTPTVSWYCNGAILKDSTEIKQVFDGQSATLKFKDVFPDDTGRYEAVATNKAGESRTACLLTVKEAKPPKAAPSFTRPLHDEAVNDGESLVLSCEYTGNPEPQLTWYHEGKVVEPCKDFQITSQDGVASLQIVEVFPEDAGLYELVAVNEKGEIKTVANLTVTGNNEPAAELEQPPLPTSAAPAAVAEKPSFKRGLQNMVVYDGDKVTLEVEVMGSLPIEVCWVHGQKEIAADDNVYQVVTEGRVHKLIIPDVLPEDEGPWLCEAYNTYGDVDTHCTLTVRGISEQSATSSNLESHSKEEFDEEAISRDKNILAERKGKIRNENLNQPPKFILKPKSLNTDEGNSAKFVCEVVGNPAPRVMWRRDGVELNSVARFRSWHDGWKHFFEISHTLVTDAGQYQCVAKSNQGEVDCFIDLVVDKLDSPAEVSDFRSLLKSRPQLGKMGNSPKSTSASESEAEQLDFRAVLTRHVKTKTKPKFTKELHDVRCQEGKAVTLTCKVTGTPAPTLTWLQGQKEIKESRFFKMSYDKDVASLHIAGVYPEDQGEYLCVAENEAGVAESICDIDIDYSRTNTPRAAAPESQASTKASLYQQDLLDLEPPFIEELSPENVAVLRGQAFTLMARFLGSPPLKATWMRGRRTVEQGERFHIETTESTSMLTVTNGECGDTGIYSLSLSNSAGVDSMTASVTVEDKPERPVGQPVASHIAAESLSLAWSGPSYDGGSQVTHYMIEVQLRGTDKWKVVCDDCQHTSYHVTGLASRQEYMFRVSAGNKHGLGEPSLPSNPVLTIDRRPSLQMAEIQHANEAHSEEAVDEYALSSPLSPLAMLAAQNQLILEPRHVDISNKKFADFYDIGEEIGKGRFGNVFTCREKSSGMQLAAKKIRVKSNQTEDVIREVEIMNQLHHSKLLLLWDAFSSPREMVLVMEHVAGGELFERIIDEDYELTEREAIHFMRQICEGLRFMHEKHILHLDLKPENILCITPNSNEVKIIDFGLARKFDPKNPAKVLFGTPEFVAPEVINYDQIGFETDMWSLGVVCYLLLSGLSPFLGDSEVETLANVTMATWDFDEGFEEIGKDARHFIDLLLVKDMSKRMKVTRALRHPWLSQDVTYMKAKRLSTQKHKHFMARRKWQKTGNAIRALGRMSTLQKAFSRQASDVSTISNSSRSRNSSFASEASSVLDQSALRSPLTPPQTNSHVNGHTQSDRRVARSSQDINSNELAKSSPQDIVPLTDEDTSQDVASTVLSSQEDATIPSFKDSEVRFVKPMKEFEVYEGDSARFDILLEHFDDRYLKVVWLKDDQEIAQNQKYRMTQTSSGKCGLIIRNCDLEDNAQYTCRVFGEDVEVQSSAELFVESLYSTSTPS